MPVTMYYEKDADLSVLKNKKVAVVGYGSQGHAHAQNLRDSGVSVIVAQRPGSKNYQLALEHEFEPMSAADATEKADLIIITVPDELAPDLYREQIAPKLTAGKAIGFTHGFNIHFGQVNPPKDVDVLMVAPKGPGHLVRSEFTKGGGVPCLLAVHRDASGRAKDIGLAWAKGIGGTRGGVIETNFRDETETDL